MNLKSLPIRLALCIVLYMVSINPMLPQKAGIDAPQEKTQRMGPALEII